MSTEQKYLASKYQGLLREYGSLLENVVAEIKKEYQHPINEDTVEKIGLKYAQNQAAREALTLLMKRINSKADERN